MNEIVKQETSIEATGYGMLSVDQIVGQSKQIRNLMDVGMSKDVHYGKIPGCGDKPTLLQPGAQKLMLMFGLADTYDINREDLPNGHREYQVVCHLNSKQTGILQGSGCGLCTTMEKKYRYRNMADFEVLEEPIPKDWRERKNEYRRQGYGAKKVDGTWRWVKYGDASAQENPDIADTYNTVLKMACKRALVAACLNSLAASDVFTQDEDDFAKEEKRYAPEPNYAPQTNRAPAKKNPTPSYLATLRELFKEAKSLGIAISDPKDPLSGLMGWIFAKFGCEPQDLSNDQIAETEQYVRQVIADKKSLEMNEEYADEEIIF